MMECYREISNPILPPLTLCYVSLFRSGVSRAMNSTLCSFSMVLLVWWLGPILLLEAGNYWRGQWKLTGDVLIIHCSWEIYHRKAQMLGKSSESKAMLEIEVGLVECPSKFSNFICYFFNILVNLVFFHSGHFIETMTWQKVTCLL